MKTQNQPSRKESSKLYKSMGTTCSVNGQRQIATLNYEMSTVWETKPRKTPQKTSRLLM
jgi:hypothetical protein